MSLLAVVFLVLAAQDPARAVQRPAPIVWELGAAEVLEARSVERPFPAPEALPADLDGAPGPPAGERVAVLRRAQRADLALVRREGAWFVSRRVGKAWSDPLRCDLPRSAEQVWLGELSTGATVVVGVEVERPADDRGPRARVWIAASEDGRRFRGHFVLPPLAGPATSLRCAQVEDQLWIEVGLDGRLDVLAASSVARLRGLPMVPFDGLDPFEPGPVGRAPVDAYLAGGLAGTERDMLLVEVAAAGTGTTVADVGFGSGRHALELARRVGETGRVLAREVRSDAVEALRREIAAEGIANVEVEPSSHADANLPSGEVDVVVLGDVLPFVVLQRKTRAAFADSLFRALRPGGRIVCVHSTSIQVWDQEWAKTVELSHELFAQAGFQVGRALAVRDASSKPIVVLEYRRPPP